MAAREAYAKRNQPVKFVSVVDDPQSLAEMLKLSEGQRKVPVIVESGQVIVGFKGKG